MDSFGTQLKRQREKKNVSLDDISAATKISNRFLNAIETDRFDQLPGGIFNRGFIRAYARHLGLDEEQTVSAYVIAAGEESTAPGAGVDSEQSVEAQPATAPNFPWGLAVLILLIVIAIVAWIMHRNAEPAQTMNATSAPNATDAQIDRPRPATTTANVETKQDAPSTTQNTKPMHGDVSAQDFRLQIIAREDSWLSISGPHGQIFHGTLAKLEEKSIVGRDRIVVRTGNAAGLEFVWNGQDVTSPGKEGEVRTVMFDGNGAHMMTMPPGTASPAADVVNP